MSTGVTNSATQPWEKMIRRNNQTIGL
ncbi:hypothetical protein BN1723_004365 [Verticillium longisporum]|uniref:Uncharacterized protein n=1 Tax=Verticillium longisporum TaxID=100787 RepID=A0A0G4MVD4_VERLO|nr:hypothetical protein BN1723_004365 [Verticillium longisporum]